jgi:hypothetical protein
MQKAVGAEYKEFETEQDTRNQDDDLHQQDTSRHLEE